MYKITAVCSFSGAHFLRNYIGKCEAVHGHNWKVEVRVQSPNLNKLGIVMDFITLRRMTNQVLDKLDHKHLNDLDYFQEINPSSEEIARYIFNQLKENITKEKCSLASVKVWETDSSCASYSCDD